MSVYGQPVPEVHDSYCIRMAVPSALDAVRYFTLCLGVIPSGWYTQTDGTDRGLLADCFETGFQGGMKPL